MNGEKGEVGNGGEEGCECEMMELEGMRKEWVEVNAGTANREVGTS